MNNNIILKNDENCRLPYSRVYVSIGESNFKLDFHDSKAIHLKEGTYELSVSDGFWHKTKKKVTLENDEILRVSIKKLIPNIYNLSCIGIIIFIFVLSGILEVIPYIVFWITSILVLMPLLFSTIFFKNTFIKIQTSSYPCEKKSTE